jgi:hypothetical protein
MKPDHPSVPNLGGTQTAQACHTPSGAWMGEDGSRRNPVGSDIIRVRRRVSEAACSPAGGGGSGGSAGGGGGTEGNGSTEPQVAPTIRPGTDALSASRHDFAPSAVPRPWKVQAPHAGSAAQHWQHWPELLAGR